MRRCFTIVGKGELARAIARRCVKEDVSYSYWEDRPDSMSSIVLYCGSERLLKEVAAFCAKTRTPLLMLSTNVTVPRRRAFPYKFVPNTSIEVQAFVVAVVKFAKETNYSRVSILESHQRDKKDISGTARLLAKELNESEKIISSIRSPKQQLALGVPKKHLDGHAYHKVTFLHEGLITDFTVLVLGRETYAKGALRIAREMLKKS